MTDKGNYGYWQKVNRLNALDIVPQVFRVAAGKSGPQKNEGKSYADYLFAEVVLFLLLHPKSLASKKAQKTIKPLESTALAWQRWEV